MNSYKESQPGMNGQPSIFHVTVEQGRHSVHIENLFRLVREKKGEIHQLRAEQGADREYIRKLEAHWREALQARDKKIQQAEQDLKPVKKLTTWLWTTASAVMLMVITTMVSIYLKNSL